MTQAPASQSSGIESRAVSGSLAGVVSLVITLAGQLVVVPFLLRAWGAEAYGAWVTIGSALALLMAFDSGHQSYIGARLNEAWHLDKSAARTVLGSALRVAFLVSCAQLGVATALWVSGLGMQVFDWDASVQAERHQAVLLMLVAQSLQGVVASLIGKLYIAAGSYARAVYLSIAQRVLSYVVLIAAALGGLEVRGTAAATVAATVVWAFPVIVDLARRYPDFVPFWGPGSVRVGLMNLARSLELAAISFVDMVAVHGVTLVTNHRLGESAVANLATQRTIANLVQQFGVMVLMPLATDFARYHVHREHQKLGETFASFWLVSGLVVGIGVLLVNLVAVDLYDVWMGGRMVLDPVVFAALASGVAIRTATYVVPVYATSINHNRPQLVVTAVRSALILGASFVLVGPFGLFGVAIAPVFVDVLTGLGAETWVGVREFGALGGQYPVRQASLAVVSLGATWAGLFLEATAVLPRFVATALAAVVVLGVGWAQWRMLGAETRARVLSLVERLARKLGVRLGSSAT